ncbi:MAG: 3-deoxy-8-phosphooctulonate synthase [Candidatus Methylomirabilis sp.]|nr:3-deoxy-8-phosphooctulonate synthase [Deltaproteobacteria bacterium]
MTLPLPRRVGIGGDVVAGGGLPFVLIAGPDCIESEALVFEIASDLKAVTRKLGVPWVFKASYDKANRTSAGSFRGPGLKRGLEVLANVKERLGLVVTTDVHAVEEVGPAAEVVDLLQIPAFLSRQTDLLAAAGRTGRAVNVKKGQFLAPWDMPNAVKKVGHDRVILTERGASFGYNNLVVDMRSLEIMRAQGTPVCFDATHSVQLPGGKGESSGGQREFVPVLARAAVAVGVDALFFEVHPDPDKALVDGPNSLRLADFPALLETLVALDRVVKGHGG